MVRATTPRSVGRCLPDPPGRHRRVWPRSPAPGGHQRGASRTSVSRPGQVSRWFHESGGLMRRFVLGEPERIPDGPNGRVILGIRPNGLDLHGVIDRALAEGGIECVSVLCGGCGGGRRAWFGSVFESSLGPARLFECVSVPKARSRLSRPAKAMREAGWRHRGEPGAPARGYLLDEWWHDDGLDGPTDVYCARHGLKIVTFAELRVDVETYRSRNRRKPVRRVL
jgi:hypothetical protein